MVARAFDSARLIRPFTYEGLGARVVFGAGCADQLTAELGRLDIARTLVITAKPDRAPVQRLIASAAGRVAGTFSEVRPHVPAEVAERARANARELGADGLICIGGGSATGLAKAVALDLELPIVAIPTTYAGSEMTPIWGLTAGRRKTTGRSPFVQPRTVLYDPVLTLKLPARTTAASGMNAIAHGVEAFYGPGANPIAALMGEEGIRALGRAVPASVRRPSDLVGRSEALYGAFLAGTAFASAGSALHHTICHVLGGAYDLPHAETHAIVLPHVVAFNDRSSPEIGERIARALGASEGAQALFELVSELYLPTGLKEIGMRRGQLEEAARLIVAAEPHSPRIVDEAALLEILEGAFAGELKAKAP